MVSDAIDDYAWRNLFYIWMDSRLDFRTGKKPVAAGCGFDLVLTRAASADTHATRWSAIIELLA